MPRLQIILFAATATLHAIGGFMVPADAATVGYWRFENDLLDLSGNGNDATATGTVYGPDASMVFGPSVPRSGAGNDFSLDLDNDRAFNPAKTADHYLEVPQPTPTLDIAMGSFTIEAWVRLDFPGNNPSRQYIVQQKDPSSSDAEASFVFMAKVGGVRSPTEDQSVMALGIPNGSVTNMIYSTLGFGLSGTDWHHISVGLDRTTGDVRFTFDGMTDLQPGVAASSLYDGMNNGQNLFIGAHSTDNATKFPTGANHGLVGGIDELRISNTFLPTSQLLAVPEPSSVTLAIAGVILLVSFMGFAARRKSNQRSLHDANQAISP